MRLTEHLAHLARLNRRQSSIDQRRWALLRLQRWLDVPLREADTSELRAFLDRPGERGVEARASEVSHLRGFYQWLLIEGYRQDDPTVRLERPARPRRLPRPMPDHDVTVALTEAPERIKPWLYLAAYAGLRACEIGPLRAEDVHDDLIVVRVQKGGDMGAVPLSPVLLPVLAGLPRQGWLFPHRGPGPVGPTSREQVQKLSNRWLHERGISHTLHTLRHWYGTHAYRVSGRDLRLTQELLRHRSVASTQIYTALDSDDGMLAVSGLPNLAASA